MKQTGNSINPANIQHFADSAKNAIQLGQRQFFTPLPLATALCSIFKPVAATSALDLSAGSGHLLTASGRKHLAGIDVDERVSESIRSASLYQADVTRWYPLAQATRFHADLILLNPPFSLQWYLDRLSGLATCTLPAVKETYAAARAKGDTMDSTLASLLIALDRLTTAGEGMMVCNADTARRLIGDPETGQGSPLLKHVWCWLDVPGATYENQQTPFPTAVLYFSASHGIAAPDGRLPLHLTAPSGDLDTVAKTLATATQARGFAICGRTITYEYQEQDWKKTSLPAWDAIRAEYHQLHHGARPDYNLSLRPDGTIRTHLDPYRRAAYVHDRALLTAFQSMGGETPAALVVQQVTRAALKHAVTSDTWRVQPELLAAVERAIAEYEAVRAPFYTPNEVQSLGWLDEESEIACSCPGIPGFIVNGRYPIRSWIEDTLEKATRNNLMGELEKLELSGRELVVSITDEAEVEHHFHVRRDENAKQKDTDKIHHHPIQSLIDHFAIPIPTDVAQTNPAAYQENLAALDRIEAWMNAA